MSYTRSTTERISVPVRIRVSDPSVSVSENGASRSSGSVSLDVGGRSWHYTIGSHGSGTSDSFDADQIIDFTIYVDTDEFDYNTARCRDSVDTLTGSVVATEAAEVATIDECSRKVGATIVKGFFSQVNSEITSKVMEYTHIVEARLAHLAQQAAELKKKQEQMTTDYRRTSARYIKIFDDLNQELENRIKNVDMPIYKFFDKVKAESDRMLDGDFVDVAAVSNSENSQLVNQIQNCIIKKHAKGFIDDAQRFLAQQRHTEATITRSTVNVPGDTGTIYLPVCVAESVTGRGTTRQDFYYDEQHITPEVKQKAADSMLSNAQLFELRREDKQALAPYINSRISEAYASQSSQHAERVKDTIIKLFNA